MDAGAGLDGGTPADPGESTGFTQNFDKLHGPPWVYVASAEELHVRAISTCTFRPERHQGSLCGPEKKLHETYDEADAGAIHKASDLLKVPLPSEPRDMILGPDQALWVSLPELGLIARIALPSEWEEPFFHEKGQLPQPQYFSLASVGDEAPGDLQVDDYRAACGLGYEMGKAAPAIALPRAPLATAGDAPRPTRLRYDESTKLLLVADEAQPGLRTFAIGSGGKLVPQGMVATGAPVRDFVITPPVPTTLPVDKGKELPLDPVNLAAAATIRYLYGIDDRDGSVFVHTFGYDPSTGLATAPVAAPYADRFSDRIDLPASSALTLEVIDTRPLSAPACGVDIAEYTSTDEHGDKHVSTNPPDGELPILGLEPAFGKTGDSDFKKLENQRKAELKAAQAAYDANHSEANKKALGLASLASAQAEDEQGIMERAGALQLRGVFVVVAGSDGYVRVIDVLDLDTWCRAEHSCQPDDTRKLRDDTDSPQPVALQRHARRIAVSPSSNAAVNDGTGLVPMETCPEGYWPFLDKKGELGLEIMSIEGDADSLPIVCLPNDPWFAQSATFNIRYEAAIPALIGTGYLQGAGATTELWAAPGFDFCARGIAPAREDGVVTDALAVVGKPQVAGCADVDPDNPALVRIVKAFSDHLVLAAEPPPVDMDASNKGRPTPNLDELMRCYPDLFDFQVWAQDEWIVSTGGLRTEHRTMADPTTRECVTDPDRDPLFTQRFAVTGLAADADADGQADADADKLQFFVNRFAAFKPAVTDHNDRNRPVSIQVTMPLSHIEAQVVDPTQNRLDSLPVTLRYFPYTGDLYIVDVASQGLRRFALSPFGSTSSTFR
jgi:hypothetical protein